MDSTSKHASGPKAASATSPYDITPRIQDAYQALQDALAHHTHLAVAFSGGVDSTLLLKVAHDVLGDRVTAFTASSAVFPQRELDEAIAFCEQEGIRQVVFEAEELEIEGFAQNPSNRCYLCKTALFEAMTALARERGIDAIVDGTNLDDRHDYRPGHQAKEEYGVASPLAEAGFDKQAIRAVSKAVGLATYDKQSFACLASRIPYGETIDEAILHKIDRAEQFLLDEGFTHVRVRVHTDIARIEIAPAEFDAVFQGDRHERIVACLRALGFRYVTLDLAGYRTGSMNEGLPTP